MLALKWYRLLTILSVLTQINIYLCFRSCLHQWHYIEISFDESCREIAKRQYFVFSDSLCDATQKFSLHFYFYRGLSVTPLMTRKNVVDLTRELEISMHLLLHNKIQYKPPTFSNYYPSRCNPSMERPHESEACETTLSFLTLKKMLIFTKVFSIWDRFPNRIKVYALEKGWMFLVILLLLLTFWYIDDQMITKNTPKI